MDNLQRKATALYESGSAIKAISRELHISEQKVRKLLITAGVYETDRSERVRAMTQHGFSTPQIAKTLKISPGAVNSYLPYTRGTLTRWDADPEAERSANARRIKACRDKKLDK